MLRVSKIISIDQQYILCELNNGLHRKLDINSIIEKHHRINGVLQLKDLTILKTAQIGEMGEIFWSNLVLNSKNETWNYDISPEYVFENGEEVKDKQGVD